MSKSCDQCRFESLVQIKWCESISKFQQLLRIPVNSLSVITFVRCNIFMHEKILNRRDVTSGKGILKSDYMSARGSLICYCTTKNKSTNDFKVNKALKESKDMV